MTLRSAEVYFVKGSPLVFSDLARAGVYSAAKIGKLKPSTTCCLFTASRLLLIAAYYGFSLQRFLQVCLEMLTLQFVQEIVTVKRDNLVP